MRNEDDNEGVSASSKHLVLVVRHLIAAGHDVHVVTGAPDFVFTSEIQSPRLKIRKVLLDCGAVQADALTVDRLASLEKVLLTSMNDSWSSLECIFGFVSLLYIAEDYSHCEFLIRLPGACIDVPLVVRRLHKSRKEVCQQHFIDLVFFNQVRRALGIAEDVNVVYSILVDSQDSYVFFFTCAALRVEFERSITTNWVAVYGVCGASETQELPPNFVKLAKDAYTPDIIAASDCMRGKIGYGTVSEALSYKVPFVFVRRDYFNEEPFLRNMLEFYQCGVEMIRRDLLIGQWKPYLERAVSLKPCYEGGINGGEIAAHILQETAIGRHCASDKLSGARRLRDAIILGYQLQRVPGRDIAIPEWYSRAENEIGQSAGSSPTIQAKENNSLVESCTDDFDILQGDVQELSDTWTFLKSLAKLDSIHDSEKSTEKKKTMRERKAAGGLFNWKDEIFVARAPGRLDVMGGIADYSGSLVLQLFYPGKHRLWKHAQARQQAKGQVATPVLYGSEISNRAPTFDMDLSDFMDGDEPISYEKARKFFAQDPAQKWAAYVAGTILVLMTELGVRFEDSLSLLVSSAVPEGKGVSSSAAVEVASMSAISFVYSNDCLIKCAGLSISPRDLAILCQKVENHIVGAPCGVMDQMTSSLIGLVEIPNHVRFWGIDSGIRHSVRGADYGSVRVGAYMGRKMIKSMASSILSQSVSNGNGGHPEELEDEGIELLATEASLDYLCNLSPHRYEARYADKLPDFMLGETFIDEYVDHDDPVTVIDQKRSYSVKAPARHPIYENFRVKTFKALLTSATSDEQLTPVGGLLYQCHYIATARAD
ncbi:hypothetical protein Bca52824_018357 [Brassica carinata]|uniref:GHMP kinase N-terminal domain-containing protein n=1 Tax=Brassica carinata TaxID=52824 RepID=A0A8X8AXC8_BRACI|nr:hypothetical protein Bca52824_018357 [Brassica carinata]